MTRFFIKFVRSMKNCLLLLLLLATLTACEQTADEKAEPLMAEIETLYEQGQYQLVLDSITSLRRQFPQAVKARKKALTLWQEASLKLTQADIARTDSALQVAIRQFNEARTIRERNFIGIRRDSLQIRYDALCGTVRVIHKRQQEN
jgi:hypothetical protein